MTLPPGYRISARPDDQQPERIHAFLTTTDWARNIPFQTLLDSLENALCLGLFHQDLQVGLVRVVTDRATFAYLCDVYVLPEHRGQGLAHALLHATFQQPDLARVRRFMLATESAHRLYARHGFSPLAHPERFMEVKRPNPYPPPADGD